MGVQFWRTEDTPSMSAILINLVCTLLGESGDGSWEIQTCRGRTPECTEVQAALTSSGLGTVSSRPQAVW